MGILLNGEEREKDVLRILTITQWQTDPIFLPYDLPLGQLLGMFALMLLKKFLLGLEWMSHTFFCFHVPWIELYFKNLHKYSYFQILYEGMTVDKNSWMWCAILWIYILHSGLPGSVLNTYKGQSKGDHNPCEDQGTAVSSRNLVSYVWPGIRNDFEMHLSWWMTAGKIVAWR
jgi:hypothetical protein